MRASACELLGALSDADFTQQQAEAVVHAVASRLKDDNVMVRNEANVALLKLSRREEIAQLLAPLAGDVSALVCTRACAKGALTRRRSC
jgi:hypothetical protein